VATATVYLSLLLLLNILMVYYAILLPTSSTYVSLWLTDLKTHVNRCGLTGVTAHHQAPYKCNYNCHTTCHHHNYNHSKQRLHQLLMRAARTSAVLCLTHLLARRVVRFDEEHHSIRSLSDLTHLCVRNGPACWRLHHGLTNVSAAVHGGPLMMRSTECRCDEDSSKESLREG
jgi:hypothetical protein